MSQADVINSLAGKLADANLSDDEANMLVALIGADDTEVEGFVDRSSPKIQGFNIGMPPRIDQAQPSKWIDVLSTDWGAKARG